MKTPTLPLPQMTLRGPAPRPPLAPKPPPPPFPEVAVGGAAPPPAVGAPRPAVDRDTYGLIADRGGAGGVGADQVALHQDARRRRIDDVESKPGVARDDVA